MPLYFSAFAGRIAPEGHSGLLWSLLPGRRPLPVAQVLGLADPWSAPCAIGPDVFTLSPPDDPEGAGLGTVEHGVLDPKQFPEEWRKIAFIRLLGALRSTGRRIDLHDGFVALRPLPQNADVLPLRGLQLQLEWHGPEVRLWAAPCVRLLDARPVSEVLAAHRDQVSDLWLPTEGFSLRGAIARPSEGGFRIICRGRARWIPGTKPVAPILGHEIWSPTPASLLEELRSLMSDLPQSVCGIAFGRDPLEASSDWTPLRVADPDVEVEGADRRIPAGKHTRAALAGEFAVRRPTQPPGTFHLVGWTDEDRATKVATMLNQVASGWPHARLQFTIDPVPGSIAVWFAEPGRRRPDESIAMRLDARTPLGREPLGPRTAGIAGTLLLECVRLCGGDPWTLGIHSAPAVIGLVSGRLPGGRGQLAAARITSKGRAEGGFAFAWKDADLHDPVWLGRLGHRLQQLVGPDDILLVDLSATPPEPLSWERLLPGRAVVGWSYPPRRVFSGISLAWTAPLEALQGPGILLTTLPGVDGGPERPIELIRLAGAPELSVLLAQILALEHAWLPGRVERHCWPLPLLWAQGVQQQRDRHLGLLLAREAV